MAKKKSGKRPAKERSLPEQMLPQNIIPVGERVEENKNIYIAQPVYKEIHAFTKNKTTNESGGMLIGNVVEAFGKTHILIRGFIEAKYCEATPTTLTFTHDTWEYCHKQMNQKFPGQKIVGWIHTHPNFGIFLSEYDTFIQENFFKEDYQVAYVVDPIQHIEGFYFWINGKIERCKGFYLFDKTGAKITAAEKPSAGEKEAVPSVFTFRNGLIAVLILCVVCLSFACLSLNGEIDTLQKQQETLSQSASESLAYMQQQLNNLSARLSALEQKTESLQTQVQPEVSSPTDTDNTEADDTQTPESQPENGTTTDTAVSTTSTGAVETTRP